PEHVVTIGKRYFYDPKDILKEVKDPFSAGIFLGEEKQGFRPTPALIDLLSKQESRRVVLDEKSAWLFLCGRDTLMQGVWKTDEFKTGEPALVSDEEGSILGYGIIKNKFDIKVKNKMFLKNMLDRGEYLRRER
ncbi:hypothetical protein GOV11_05370, partial [Candidatus Woesearchaeota archaeon]|nr:hypothetical protein [Candidatus Woesearchaeota archaeon]